MKLAILLSTASIAATSAFAPTTTSRNTAAPRIINQLLRSSTEDVTESNAPDTVNGMSAEDAAAAAAAAANKKFEETGRVSDADIAAKWEANEMLPTEVVVAAQQAQAQMSKTIALNGWTPDESKPCWGLPGAVAPTGYFDPIGFAQNGITLNEVKRYREAEVQHGRVAMLATVGYFVGEAFPGPFGLTGPANDQLSQLPLPVLLLFGFGIGYGEIQRARTGWVKPDFANWTKTLWTLRDNYYPGDVGFDPLGIKPFSSTEKGAEEFAKMQTKELQNGRLAMIGVAGMCAQELVNHRTIFGTIEFYNKVYNGIDPYANCADGVIC